MTKGEKITDIVNKTYFFKEFSFSKNEFTPKNNSELQLADLIIAIDKTMIIIQHKERDKNAINNKISEIKWINNKVKNKAKRQIKNTISYLSSYESIKITNNRGHIIDLNSNNFNKISKIIMYESDYKYEASIENEKFVNSKDTGIIHILSREQYELICYILQTPLEIFEYFNFREQIFHERDVVNSVSEKALLGYFINNDFSLSIGNDFSMYCDKYCEEYTKDKRRYDLKFLIDNFYSRIIGKNKNKERYYPIVRELAKLRRKEIEQFNIRLSKVIENSKTKIVPKPHWFPIPHLNCSFVFSSVPVSYKIKDAIDLLRKYTILLKYDNQVEKCIGLIVIQEQDNYHYQIHWCCIENEWKYNPEIEDYLEPIRKL